MIKFLGLDFIKISKSKLKTLLCDLVEAKGYKLRSNGPGRAGNRSSRGRQAEFRTKVHGNGNLLIGHAYTKKLGLEPGQEFRIDVRKESGAISLLPLKK